MDGEGVEVSAASMNMKKKKKFGREILMMSCDFVVFKTHSDKLQFSHLNRTHLQNYFPSIF